MFSTTLKKISTRIFSWIYGSWFPSGEYQPADALPYEVYPELPEDGKLTVEICVPVRSL